MSDQQAFNEAKALAEAERQRAIRQAHRVFDRAVAVQQSAQFARYRAARDAWDAVKSDRDAEGYENARAAFHIAQQTANHEAAYEELERAVQAADAAYRAQVHKLAAEHGVSVL
jgi:hypothetical protein